MACLQLILSIFTELDVQITKLCHSPMWFSCHQGLFGFRGGQGGCSSYSAGAMGYLHNEHPKRQLGSYAACLCCVALCFGLNIETMATRRYIFCVARGLFPCPIRTILSKIPASELHTLQSTALQRTKRMHPA